jgi:histidinol dehydrogenase
MKTIIYPPQEEWEALCKRPALERKGLEKTILNIINEVKKDGDKALFRFTEEFDGVSLDSLKVTAAEILESEVLVPDDLKAAIKIAWSNIYKFHAAQLVEEPETETTEGVRCWRKNVAIEKVGLYIPGGSAPLFSTVLMLSIPAKLAGCNEIVLCSPPGNDGKVNPLIIYAARIAGITEIFKVGGAQAIAAMAYGTESVHSVYKIFGPGNQYVTKAKEIVSLDGIHIDMPAGPSEVVVIADSEANPAFVAADLLSQAEHGADSQVLLLTDSRDTIDMVKKEIEIQLNSLPRKETAIKALKNSSLILMKSPEECMDFSNIYAPEHLIINTLNANDLAKKVINAGSVFLGPYSCESAGDYASGTNHTLPTNGYAKSYGGISTESFMKKISFQELSEQGMRNLGPVISLMAEAESLQAHKNAVSVRIKSFENERDRQAGQK